MLAECLAVVGGEDDDRPRAEGLGADEADHLAEGAILEEDGVAVEVLVALVVGRILADERRLEGRHGRVDAVGRVGVAVVHDAEEGLVQGGQLGLDPGGEQLVLAAEVDVGEGVEIGRAALVGGGQVLHEEARVGEHHVVARPVRARHARRVRVVEEQRRRVERLARRRGLQARPQHRELDRRGRRVRSHLQERVASGGRRVALGGDRAGAHVLRAARVGADALGEDEDHVAPGDGGARRDRRQQRRRAQARPDLRWRPAPLLSCLMRPPRAWK